MKPFIKMNLALLVLVISMGCKKEMMAYKGLEGIYFAVQHGASYGSELTWPYQPSSEVQFVKYVENEITVQLKVTVTGPVKDYDRPFRVRVLADSTTAQFGVHYKNIPEQLVVKANEFTAYIPITLLRATDLLTDEKKLTLQLIENESFKLAFPEWDAIPGFSASTAPIPAAFDASKHTVNINDFMVQPGVWIGSIQAGNRESGQWGAFSKKKIELMCSIMNLTYADFASTATMPSVLSGLLASECAKYLIQKFNEGNPILEEDGRLMFIGNVPWTSYIGVPWVP